jgi:hypothetical protein
MKRHDPNIYDDFGRESLLISVHIHHQGNSLSPDNSTDWISSQKFQFLIPSPVRSSFSFVDCVLEIFAKLSIFGGLFHVIDKRASCQATCELDEEIQPPL